MCSDRGIIELTTFTAYCYPPSLHTSSVPTERIVISLSFREKIVRWECIDHSFQEWSFTDHWVSQAANISALEGMLFESSCWLSLTESAGAAKRLYLIIVQNINHLLCTSPLVNKQKQRDFSYPAVCFFFSCSLIAQASPGIVKWYDRRVKFKNKNDTGISFLYSV